MSGVGFQSGSFLGCALLFGGLDDFLDLLSFCGAGAARLLSVRGMQTLCEFLSQCGQIASDRSVLAVVARIHRACRRCVAPGTAT